MGKIEAAQAQIFKFLDPIMFQAPKTCGPTIPSY